jgi:hypothetical protein
MHPCPGCRDPVPNTRTFCGRSCARKHRPPTRGACVVCGAEFHSTSAARKFCSVECRESARIPSANRHGLSRPQKRWIRARNAFCAVCASTRRLVIDHDHHTGTIRGLLCASCNSAIGQAGESADRLRKLAAYLEDAPPVVIPGQMTLLPPSIAPHEPIPQNP